MSLCTPRRRVKLWVPALLALPYSPLSLALDKATIVPSVSSPDCITTRSWGSAIGFGAPPSAAT